MKAKRHALILELIEKKPIETQEDLANALREQNVDVTQATVSRDIKELRLLKVLADNGQYKYATSDTAERGLTDRFIRIFSEAVLSITTAGNLIIFKTLSGTANAAAEAVDGLKWPEIAGSLAGDNTIFVAVREAGDVENIVSRFRHMIK